MGLFEQYEARAMRHAKEDSHEAELQKKAEPIVARLKAGKNYLNPREFRDVAEYMLAVPGEPWGEKPLSRGRFLLGSVEVIRVRWPNASRQLSVLQLSRLAGLSKSQMTRLLDDAQIPFLTQGQKRLYDFGVLETFRDRIKQSA